MTALLSRKEIASGGQTLIQTPHPVHFWGSTFTAIVLTFLFQLSYSFLNLLHLLAHCLSLLLEYGQLVALRQVLDRLLRHRDRPLGKTSSHTLATTLTHASAHTSASTHAPAHTSTRTTSPSSSTTTSSLAHTTSHAHSSTRRRILLWPCRLVRNRAWPAHAELIGYISFTGGV